MFNIGEFLSRFRNARSRELAFRSAVQETLKQKFLLEVPFEDISLKGGVIFIKNISQAARSEIFIKKQSILQSINSSQSVYKIQDIR